MMTIQQVSREINLNVDTLRMWERRYGFPQPVRDSRGHRRYPPAQVDELRQIKVLQDLGYRPQKIFSLAGEQRRLIIASHHQSDNELSEIKNLVLTGAIDKLRTSLLSYRDHHGIEKLIFHRIIPLTRFLGLAWVEGTLTIAREHLISDLLVDILQQQLNTPQTPPADLRVLFLTLCGERHKIGLLMAATLLHQEGIDCILIQEDLPIGEIPDLVTTTGSQAVALSFSLHYSARQARRDLASLRRILPDQITIVAGGQSISRDFHLPGLVLCPDLEQLSNVIKKLS